MRELGSHKTLEAAAALFKREMEGGIAYVDDRVIPAVRRGSMDALLHGARLLRRCADLLDGGARP